MSTPSAQTFTAHVRARRIRLAVAAVLFAVAAGLGAVTWRHASALDSINPAERLAPFPDPSDRDKTLRDVVGTFSTGTEPGDRMIIVLPNGRIQFRLVGPMAAALQIEDTYELGLRGDHACLATTRSGTVERVDLDELSYFGNSYTRDQPNGPARPVRPHGSAPGIASAATTGVGLATN